MNGNNENHESMSRRTKNEDRPLVHHNLTSIHIIFDLVNNLARHHATNRRAAATPSPLLVNARAGHKPDVPHKESALASLLCADSLLEKTDFRYGPLQHLLSASQLHRAHAAIGSRKDPRYTRQRPQASWNIVPYEQH